MQYTFSQLKRISQDFAVLNTNPYQKGDHEGWKLDNLKKRGFNVGGATKRTTLYAKDKNGKYSAYNANEEYFTDSNRPVDPYLSIDRQIDHDKKPATTQDAVNAFKAKRARGGVFTTDSKGDHIGWGKFKPNTNQGVKLNTRISSIGFKGYSDLVLVDSVNNFSIFNKKSKKLYDNYMSNLRNNIAKAHEDEIANSKVQLPYTNDLDYTNLIQAKNFYAKAKNKNDANVRLKNADNHAWLLKEVSKRQHRANHDYIDDLKHGEFTGEYKNESITDPLDMLIHNGLSKKVPVFKDVDKKELRSKTEALHKGNLDSINDLWNTTRKPKQQPKKKKNKDNKKSGKKKP